MKNEKENWKNYISYNHKVNAELTSLLLLTECPARL